MATYYNITATVGFDQIEADSPQQAAAKAHALILAQLAQPERILVWETEPKPDGGVKYTSTAWTFADQPEQLIYEAKSEPKPAVCDNPQAEAEVPLPVESDAPSDSPALADA